MHWPPARESTSIRVSLGMMPDLVAAYGALSRAAFHNDLQFPEIIAQRSLVAPLPVLAWSNGSALLAWLDGLPVGRPLLCIVGRRGNAQSMRSSRPGLPLEAGALGLRNSTGVEAPTKCALPSDCGDGEVKPSPHMSTAEGTALPRAALIGHSRSRRNNDNLGKSDTYIM